MTTNCVAKKYFYFVQFYIEICSNYDDDELTTWHFSLKLISHTHTHTNFVHFSSKCFRFSCSTSFTIYAVHKSLSFVYFVHFLITIILLNHWQMKQEKNEHCPKKRSISFLNVEFSLHCTYMHCLNRMQFAIAMNV